MKIRLLQEEEGTKQRDSVLYTGGESALVSSRRPSRRTVCPYCKILSHSEDRCYKKFPELRPKARGMVADVDPADPTPNISDDDSSYVCFIGATLINNTDTSVAFSA